MKKRFAYILLLILIINCVTGCANKTQKVLSVGVRSDVMNFGFYNEVSQKYSGLEVDIAKELCKRLGYRNVEFYSVTASDREAQIGSGALDMVLGCYAYSEKRAENNILSVPYYTSRFVILSEHSALFKSVNDYEGCIFGIIDSNAVEDTLNAILEENQVKRYRIVRRNSYDELYELIDAGEIDAIALDSVFMYKYINASIDIAEFENWKTDFCVLISDKSGLSKNEVDEALSEMDKDGTLAFLKDKWCTGGYTYE